MLALGQAADGSRGPRRRQQAECSLSGTGAPVGLEGPVGGSRRSARSRAEQARHASVRLGGYYYSRVLGQRFVENFEAKLFAKPN